MRIFKNIKVWVATLGLAALAIAGVSQALSHTARAATTHYTNFSGASCVASAFAPTGAVETSQFGVHNPSTLGDVRVICPMPVDVNNLLTLPTHVVLGAYDRSTTSNVTCEVMMQATGDGHFESLGTVQTSNGSANDPYQSQTVTLPRNPVIRSSQLYLDCIIPKMQFANPSHLQSYTLITTGA